MLPAKRGSHLQIFNFLNLGKMGEEEDKKGGLSNQGIEIDFQDILKKSWVRI